MKSFRVALLANLKKNAPHIEGVPEDMWADLDSEKTVNALVEAIRDGGHTCEFLEGNITLFDTVRKFKPDICFNICEGHYGDAREAQVPAILEMLRIPYTGSRVLTLALALDKSMTKRILCWHELPTPAFQSFERADEPLNDDMVFPLFCKPSREGTGMGVTGKSILHNEAELREQVAYVLNRYKQPALVEKYIAGRQVTVGLVGNLEGPVARRLPENEESPRIQAGLRFFPPMEVDLKPFEHTDVVYSNRLKVALADQLTYLCPAPIDEDMVDELNWLAAAVFRVTGAHDVSRVDFRLDAFDNWKPYILE
ncbi:MAG: D-alanine--D-alanine ligase, partial [Chloroflexota bacterium]